MRNKYPDNLSRQHNGLSQNQNKTILFIGNYRATIPLIHEFQALGYRIIVGVTEAAERGYAASRYIDERWWHQNPEENAGQFIDQLNSFIAERDDISHVMPVSEDMLVLIQSHINQLQRSDIYAMLAPELVWLCLDKARILAFAENAGVTQSPFAIVKSYADLLSQISSIGFPVAIRPIHTALKFGTRKALLCQSYDELKAQLPAWPEPHEKLIVQKQFFGRRHNLYFAARNGQIFRLLETVADRTDHADGTGLAVKGRTIEITPSLRQDVETLVQEMNYQGIGCAQFLVNEVDQTHSFLEINPRIAGNHKLPANAGLMLGPLMVALTQTQDIEGLDCETFIIAKPGQTYIWTYGDLGGCFKEFKNGQIGFLTASRWLLTALADAVRSDMHMTWSVRDPMPAIAGFGQKLRAVFNFTIFNQGSLKQEPDKKKAIN